MFQADHGDAFLLSFGENMDVNILIDMGLPKTYEEQIKPELLKLNNNGKKIDLLVVTHIDNDHITGAIPFLYENGVSQSIIKVEEVWHNSYRHLQFDKKKGLELSSTEKIALEELIKQNQGVKKDDGLSDIAIKEGTTFASLLYKYKYNWNSSFNNEAVSIENGLSHNIQGLKIILLSPNNDKLKKLSNKWENKLSEIIYNFTLNKDELFDDACELYMQNINDSDSRVKDASCSVDMFDIEGSARYEESDSSVTNGSSISFIIEYQDTKMLFLGDSHEDIIFNRLKYLQDNDYRLDFELVKLSHHGSNKNISNRLLSLINSKRYLISTNGKGRSNHPDIESIAKIALKASISTKEIIFNYEHSKLSSFINADLKDKYKYEFRFSSEIKIK